MAKTITLQNTEIQSIVLTNLAIPDNVKKGYASNINYAVQDDSGNNALFTSSLKYTPDSEYSDDFMSATAETHLKAYLDEMKKLMVEREEL